MRSEKLKYIRREIKKMTYEEMKKILGNGFNQEKTLEVLQMLQCKQLEVFIDAYKNNPFMLLCRSRNKKAEVTITDNRIQIQNKDRNSTMLLNVPLDEVQNLMMNIQEGNSKKCHTKIYRVFFELASDIDIQYDIHLFDYDA